MAGSGKGQDRIALPWHHSLEAFAHRHHPPTLPPPATHARKAGVMSSLPRRGLVAGSRRHWLALLAAAGGVATPRRHELLNECVNCIFIHPFDG